MTDISCAVRGVRSPDGLAGPAISLRTEFGSALGRSARLFRLLHEIDAEVGDEQLQLALVFRVRDGLEVLGYVRHGVDGAARLRKVLVHLAGGGVGSKSEADPGLLA